MNPALIPIAIAAKMGKPSLALWSKYSKLPTYRIYPMTPRHAVMAGPTKFNTVPPKFADRNHTEQRVALTTCTV